MKQLSLVISVVALLATGILFYLFFSEKHPEMRGNRNTVTGQTSAGQKFAIAYFDMDSLENNYQYFKDALSALKVKENSLNSELAGMEKTYQKKIAEWQQKGNSMSQSEADAANREYQQMQQQFASRKQQMEQTMENLKRDEMAKIRKKLEDFLKEYNKDNRYNYIFSYTPEFMFYRDTIYNITNDVVRGLNEAYKKK